MALKKSMELGGRPIMGMGNLVFRNAYVAYYHFHAIKWYFPKIFSYFCIELARGDILAIWKAFMLLSKLTKSGNFCGGKIIDQPCLDMNQLRLFI